VSPEIGAAVVSFNTRELTLRCLEATERAAGGRDVTLTLVDNGSGDGTAEVVRRGCPGWSVIVLPANPGYGAALNRAFAQRPARLYLALNADVVLEADALERLLDFLDKHPRCGLVGPALSYPDGRPQPSAKRFPGLGFAIAETLWVHELLPRNRWVARFYYAGLDLSRPATVEAVSGAAMLIRAEAFHKVDGFDEAFRMYFEETDLCRRLSHAGFEVALCPGARAVHWHGASTSQTSVRDAEYYVNYVRFFRKHVGRGQACVLAAAILLRTVIRTLALIVRNPPLSSRRAARLAPKLAANWHVIGAVRQAVCTSEARS
jgi:GT2 family glycosyltransferase